MQTELPFQRTMRDAFRKNAVRANLDSLVGALQGSSKQPLLDSLAALARVCYRHPLFLIGALWPLVLLTPHVPGIPRPLIGGLPWRQELALSVLIAIALGILIKRRQNQKTVSIERSALPVIFSLGVFASWALASVAWAANPYAAMHLGMQWSLYLVFYFLMNSILKNPRLIRSSIGAFAGVILVLAIACAIESWFGAPLTDGNLRHGMKPILRGSSGFGEIMAMAAILFAGLSLNANRRGRALLFGATAMMGWLATLQTLERAPLIGAVAGFSLLIGGAALGKPIGRRPWGRLGLMVGALGLILFFQTVPIFTPLAETTASSSTVSRLTQNLSADVSTRVRFLFWGVGLEMVRAHPLLGVGGNNYEEAYPLARAEFSARNPNSPLISLNEDLLTVFAHNEYVQLIAELGVIGLLLFVVFSVSLVATLWRALRHKSQGLLALGAGGAMLSFAVSSGASASSFRYFGGGLVFFFAAAILTRIAGAHASSTNTPKVPVPHHSTFQKVMTFGLFALMLLTIGVLGTQSAGTMLFGLAQASAEPAKAEAYYQSSLRIYPTSAATHFGYGSWLYANRRAAEAVSHLRYAVENGYNSSICYASLARAADAAQNLTLAEQTLATAVRVYPASVFLLVRYSAILARNGRAAESKEVFSRALLLDPRATRGWQQLIDNDIDAAHLAAKQDPNIAQPGELYPESAVFEVLKENEQRFPGVRNSGWRARMRAKHASKE